MAQLQSIVRYFDSLLTPDQYGDSALNGLQVDSGVEAVSKVAFAVDAGLSVMESAIKEDAQLLVVHHGILWGASNQPITSVFGEKIQCLIKNGCSLYASHLPLDGHGELGNNAQIAQLAGLKSIKPFCEYMGMPVGAQAEFSSELDFSQAAAAFQQVVQGPKPISLSFGSDKIKKVGIVSGSGSFAIPECAQEGLDLLVSGEPKQEAYHMAKEYGVNALFLGHYATETFGVRALMEKLSEDHDVDTVFIDEPTGI